MEGLKVTDKQQLASVSVTREGKLLRETKI